MDQAQFAQQFQHYANDLLTWVGFGTLAGLLAKAIMPGRDPGGAIATLVMGIGGSILGSGVLMFFWNGHHVTPLSVEGFGVATAGAFILLAFYRFFRRDRYIEGERTNTYYPRYTATRSRRPRERVYDD
jgi:uncharacterized membrane protein YeaQ/YmgE (transglycosylase-associated protein family)